MLLDIEITLNNRPLKYLEDDMQFPDLTPNTLGFGEETSNLAEDINMIERDLGKRAKYVKKCKTSAWNRWKGEYLKSILKTRNMGFRKESRPALAIREVVIIKGKERNRNSRRLGIVVELFKGKNGNVHAAKIRCGKSELERAVQHLYPLHLHCDWKYSDYIKTNKVNDDGKEQKSRRSKRTAAVIVKMKIRDKIEDEQGCSRVELEYLLLFVANQESVWETD